MSEMRGLRPHDAERVNPADRAQLDRKPVPPKRLLALFKPHAGTITLVMGLIVVSSLAGLAQPFLVREGLLVRTTRGRAIPPKGCDPPGVPPPAGNALF